MQIPEDITVIIGETRIQVSRKIVEVSQYFHNILSFCDDEAEIQIDENIISVQTFYEFIRFWELNNYTEPILALPIRTNKLIDVMNKTNYEFALTLAPQSERLVKLAKASLFLDSKGLKRIIAAIHATKIYFEDSRESFQNKLKQLNMPLDGNVTFEKQQKFHTQYFLKKEEDSMNSQNLIPQ